MEDDECLSIHASENETKEDYKTLGLTEPTKKVTGPDNNKSDEILLKELADSLDDNEATGENVKRSWQALSNIKPGIWIQLNASQKKADLQVANIQQNLQKNCCHYCTNSRSILTD